MSVSCSSVALELVRPLLSRREEDVAAWRRRSCRVKGGRRPVFVFEVRDGVVGEASDVMAGGVPDVFDQVASGYFLTVPAPVEQLEAAGVHVREAAERSGLALFDLVGWCLLYLWTRCSSGEVVRSRSGCVRGGGCVVERGASGFLHCHLVLYDGGVKSRTAGRVVVEAFAPVCVHFEARRGSVSDCLDYLNKRGRFVDKCRRVSSSVFVDGSGVGPCDEAAGGVSVVSKIDEMIKQGARPSSIVSELGVRAAGRLSAISSAYWIRKRDEIAAKGIERDVVRVWLCGAAGSGKTYTAEAWAREHFPGDYYIVTDAAHPWDGYEGEACVIIDEWRSSMFPLREWLGVSDSKYKELPARYSNKFAAWSVLIVCSTVSLCEAYAGVLNDIGVSEGAEASLLVRSQVFRRFDVAGYCFERRDEAGALVHDVVRVDGEGVHGLRAWASRGSGLVDELRRRARAAGDVGQDVSVCEVDVIPKLESESSKSSVSGDGLFVVSRC